jgi:hypothetical protein
VGGVQYDAFGDIGTTLPEKIGLFHSSSRKEVLVSPIAAHAGMAWVAAAHLQGVVGQQRERALGVVAAGELVVLRPAGRTARAQVAASGDLHWSTAERRG